MKEKYLKLVVESADKQQLEYWLSPNKKQLEKELTQTKEEIERINREIERHQKQIKQMDIASEEEQIVALEKNKAEQTLKLDLIKNIALKMQEKI